MSMANSLEVRVPYLDHTFVEFAATIPAPLKVRGLKLKYILRRALATCLPSGILRRPKRGFDIPLGAWLRGPLREFALDTLAEHRIRETGLLDWSFLKRVLDEHMSSRHDHRQLIWPLVVFEFWRQRYSPAVAAA
jgi:asparagine synthase (glutamine-hydrolysing)